MWLKGYYFFPLPERTEWCFDVVLLGLLPCRGCFFTLADFGFVMLESGGKGRVVKS